METKDSFIFYRSFFEAASALPDTERLHLMDAICEFGLNHKQLELDSLSKAMFCLIKPQLEANHKKWLNGKKGGRPKALEPEVKDKKKPKRNRNKTKDKPNVNDNVNVNVNVNKNEYIDNFQPDETSIRRINEKYPELMDYQVLVDAFIDQAKNREKPLKDYQAGFRRYLKEGWITPYSSEKQMSHSHRASMMIKNSKINNPLIPNMRIAK